MEQKIILDGFFPWWVLLLLGALYLLSIGYSYSRLSKKLEPSQRASLLLLRLVVFLLPLFYFAHPIVRQSDFKEVPRHLVLLQDVSQSMDVLDYRGLSRNEGAQVLLQNNHDLLQKIKNKFPYHYFSFSDKLNSKDKGSTALGDCLKDVTFRIGRDRLVAIVVLSDGRNNWGSSPLEEAVRLGEKSVPIYCFPFGLEKKNKFIDIQAQNIIAQKRAFVGLEVPLLGEFVFRGLQGKKVRLQLKVEGKKISSQVLSISSNLVTRRVSFVHTFPTSGIYKVTLTGQPVQGEGTTENNSISTFVRVETKDLHILYLERSPRWELKFLRRAFREDKNLTLEMRFLSGSTFRANPPIQWTKYHGIILGDVPPGYFSSFYLRKLKSAIFDHKVGLILLGGKDSFSRGGYSRTALGPALPVGTYRAQYRSLALSPTPSPGQTNHFILRLSKKKSPFFWSTLPPWEGVITGVTIKGGARTLLEDARSKKPLLVIQPNAGLGRTAVLLTDNTWAWVMERDDGKKIHQRFWSQLLLWVTGRDKKGKNSLWLDQEKYRYLLGEKVVIQGHVRDYRGRVVKKAKVRGILQYPGGIKKIDFSFQGNSFVWNFQPTQTGEYKLKVRAVLQGKTLGPVNTAFMVHKKNLEMANLSPDLNLLKQISRVSGGKTLKPAEFPKLLKALLAKPSQLKIKIEEREKNLMDPRLLFLAFIFLLGLEWYLRRQMGLL